jgi:hypothetical protein
MMTFLFSQNANARFVLDDAEFVDREERINTETYNDKISYRYPTSWRERWMKSDNGFQINAGSLNVSEFDYSQDIKFHSGWDNSASLSFIQYRREDFIEGQDVQEVHLTKYLPADLYISMLADGGTHKQFGDLGLSMGFGTGSDHFVEFYYWSVDHYYKTKKAFVDDSREKNTYSTGVKWHQIIGGNTVSGYFENDSPLEWHRKSAGYFYEYTRARGRLSLEVPLKSRTLFAKYDFDDKSEGKSFYGTDAVYSHDKKLIRKTFEGEVGYIFKVGENRKTVGLQGIMRRADYEFNNYENLESDNIIENIGAEYSRRKEAGLYYTDYFGSGSNYYQWGMYLNQVKVDQITYDQDGIREETEAKLGLAYEYRVSEHSQILLNTTWDLDRIYEDAPYEEHDFKPWGGGNIQLQAAF